MRLFNYGPSANCLKARVTARLAGVELELVDTDIFAGATLTDEYATINPMRQVPVLELDDGRFLTESNAIALFLADGTPLVPDDAADRAQVHSWLFFERAFTPAVGGLRFIRLSGREPAVPEEMVADMQRNGKRCMRTLEEHLDGRTFLVTDALTVADVVLWAYAHVAHEGGFEVGPNVRAWSDRVSSAPGVVDDLEPYPPNAQLGVSRSIYG
jgi:glutathione S-transferase